MNSRNLILSILTPKIFFGVLNTFDSKGMDYSIEIRNDNTIHFYSWKIDNSIQIIQSFELSDIINFDLNEFDIDSLIFKLNFKRKTKSTLKDLTQEIFPCKITLIIHDNKNTAQDILLTNYNEDLKYELGAMVESNSIIKRYQHRQELLSKLKDKPLLEFDILYKILSMNLKNKENNLSICFFQKKGDMLIFSNDGYNLHVLTELISQDFEFMASFDSELLNYLDNENYHVKVYSDYIFLNRKLRKQNILYILRN